MGKISQIFKEIKKYEKVLDLQGEKYNCSIRKLKLDCFLCRFFHGALPEQYVSLENEPKGEKNLYYL